MPGNANSAEQRRQRELVEALRSPDAYPHPVGRVEVLETHISTVLLAGEFAYKLKKPVDLGFVDFTTLEQRRFYCAEEIRVNARAAPTLYLGIVPITIHDGRVRMGNGGDPLEFAVRMRRFPQDALLAEVARKGPLPPALVDRMADVVAAMHDSAPVAAPDSEAGQASVIRERMEENFQSLAELPLNSAVLRTVEALRGHADAHWKRLAPVMKRRRDDGRVRECHGDLRWIDTASDLAFLLMDLRNRDQPTAANRLLSRYLELTGDYSALGVIDFYVAYRAMVRAKIEGIRWNEARDSDAAAAIESALRRYLELAGRPSAPPRLLVITHGVSGSGKSTVAEAMVERFGYIRLRSDVERKRAFGLHRLAGSASGTGQGIYTEDATELTYQRLGDLARTAVEAGHVPVVDASFLKASARAEFERLADELQAEFRILDVRADDDVIRRRLRQRAGAGNEPSEADERILDHQLATRDPLTDWEKAHAVTVD
ncbi:MAG: AAA family ATPase, partial [Ectothiorhodospiraceae bacterium]